MEEEDATDKYAVKQLLTMYLYHIVHVATVVVVDLTVDMAVLVADMVVVVDLMEAMVVTSMEAMAVASREAMAVASMEAVVVVMLEDVVVVVVVATLYVLKLVADQLVVDEEAVAVAVVNSLNDKQIVNLIFEIQPKPTLKSKNLFI